MLVLSRRPGEKILFPSVGISVEVIQTKGNTVRVGIEAPEDIRILRGELKQHIERSENPPPLAISNRTDFNALEAMERETLDQRVDEIGLVLALAQNQQRQGLSDHVDVALEQALERLNELKKQLQDLNQFSATVCESKPTYQTSQSDVWLQLDSNSGGVFRIELDVAA